MAASWRTDPRAVEASPGNGESKRAAERARVRDERRRQAEANAHQLLAEARRLAPTTVIPHTLRLLSRTLAVDHVTLAIGSDTRPHTVFYANPGGATALSWPDLRNELEPPIAPPVDGAVSRLHAFLYGAGDPDLRGCLTLHSMQPRSFRAPEVALVDALVELLARELERSRAVPGRTEPNRTPAPRAHPAGV
ncbi:MAG TPA: hypothetical protein VFU46_09075 [Gemmatimonadales bacterium]|nr:hypothetical protein [Gemmatimonadales bacterium]